MNKPNLYVVTVNYHNRDAIIKMIGALDGTRSVKKLIIVNHSNDDLSDLNADFPILIIHQHNRGYGAGINRGMAAIQDSAAVALMCNPDLRVLTPGKLPQLVEFLQTNPNVGLLAPAFVDGNNNRIASCRNFYNWLTLFGVRISSYFKVSPRFVADHYCGESVNSNGPVEIDWGSGAALFGRVDILQTKLKFDERFFLYFEDLDICLQSWRAGLAVMYYPEVICLHEESKASRTNLKFFGYHFKSMLSFMWKYKGLPGRPL